MRAPELAGWVALRSREARDARGAHVVCGVRFVVAAVDHGADVLELLVAPALLRSVVGQMIVRRLRARGVPVTRVDPDAFAATFPERAPQGLAAVLRNELIDPGELAARRDPLWLAVESVRSPGNLGSAMRTAAAVGASGVVAIRPAAGPPLDLFAPDVVRAAMGAASSLGRCVCSVAELRRVATRDGLQLVGASPDARHDYRAIDWTRPTVLVVGAERGGLSPAQRAACDTRVRIPMSAGIDSLNLAVATSILLYESYAQRHPLRRRHARP